MLEIWWGHGPLVAYAYAAKPAAIWTVAVVRYGALCNLSR